MSWKHKLSIAYFYSSEYMCEQNFHEQEKYI